MKVKYLGHYNSAPFLCMQTMSSLIWRYHILKMKEGHVFSGIKSMIYSFSVPCCKWLLRGEAGLMNGFCLPLYCFLLFLYRSQSDCELLKGKVKYHRAENQLPRSSTASLQSGSFTQIFITYSLVEFWWPPNIHHVCGFFEFPLGTGPFAKEAVWLVLGALEPVHFNTVLHLIALYWGNYLTLLCIFLICKMS